MFSLFTIFIVGIALSAGTSGACFVLYQWNASMLLLDPFRTQWGDAARRCLFAAILLAFTCILLGGYFVAHFAGKV